MLFKFADAGVGLTASDSGCGQRRQNDWQALVPHYILISVPPSRNASDVADSTDDDQLCNYSGSGRPFAGVTPVTYDKCHSSEVQFALHHRLNGPQGRTLPEPRRNGSTHSTERTGRVRDAHRGPARHQLAQPPVAAELRETAGVPLKGATTPENLERMAGVSELLAVQNTFWIEFFSVPKAELGGVNCRFLGKRAVSWYDLCQSVKQKRCFEGRDEDIPANAAEAGKNKRK